MAATPVCISAYDMTMDGMADLVIGWSDGTVEVRTDRPDGAGEVIAKDKFGAGIAGIVAADYRMDGTTVLLVVSVTGEVRGYLPFGVKAPTQSLTPAAEVKPHEQPSRSNSSVMVKLQAKLQEWERRKRVIMAELEAGEHRTGGSMDPSRDGAGMAVQDPKVSVSIKLVDGDARAPMTHLHVTLSLGIDATISMVVMQAGGLFDDETFIAYEDHTSPSASIDIAVLPPKNQAYSVRCKVVFGPSGRTVLQIHELTIDIPAFAMFQASNVVCSPEESVQLPLRGKAFQSQIEEWLELNFLAPRPVLGSSGIISVHSLRENVSVSIALEDDAIVVSTQSMEIAGDLLQSMLRHCKVMELNSVAAFPTEIGAFRTVLGQINDLQSVRLKLSAEIAEKSNLAKGLLFQAEDARLLRDHGSMNTSYRSLFTLNRDLIAEYAIRCTNHNELLDTLKSVNQFIQCASRLRVGKAKSAVVHGCREALQANNVDQIVNVVELGAPQQ
jgi:Bardet-Biedl syndrome 2 protein